MRHLTAEELARLVDESPTDAESTHRERCGHCASEVEALKKQTALLTTLEDPPLPAALREQVGGLVRREVAGISRPRSIHRGWMRAAAAIALFVSGAATGALVAAPASNDAVVVDSVDAAEALAVAEAAYLEAIADFARATGTVDGLDPMNRLAALEGIVLTTRSALREAPADPVINSYHLTAMSQRDALIREIADVTATEEWY